MPTLSDVAKIAGVGVMSVSRVVNGSRKVSPDIESKVRAALKKIGYEPNEAARILKGHRARVIGVIVPDLSNPFFANCVNEIQCTFREAGYISWMAASNHREEIERQDIQTMVQRKVAGLLVVPSGFQIDHFSQARRSGIPIVAFDRPITSVEADTLTVDNRAAAARATQHLIDHCHRHIVCVRRTDDDKLYTRTERIAGYSEVMDAAKYPVRFCYVPGDLNEPFNNQLESVMNSVPVPTAIFAVDNVVAVDVLRALQRLSIKVPEQVALIAFDDFDAATLMRPTITAVRQPVAQIGRDAAALLLARIDGDNQLPSRPIHTVLPTELVIRESCGCTHQGASMNHKPTRQKRDRETRQSYVNSVTA